MANNKIQEDHSPTPSPPEEVNLCVPCSEEQLLGIMPRDRNWWEGFAFMREDMGGLKYAKWDGDGVPADVFVMHQDPDCTCDEDGPEDFAVWKDEYLGELISSCPTSQASTADAIDESEIQAVWKMIEGEWVLTHCSNSADIPCCPDREPDSVPTYQSCDGQVCSDPHVTTFFGEKYDM